MASTNKSQPQQAQCLRSYHQPGKPLVLPNVWDAASAQAVEAAGFAAVATGSAAIAEVLGYADHEGAPPEEMFGMAERIARVVELPVTVDVEAGYGLEPTALVDWLLKIEAAGCNLEDSNYRAGGLTDITTQADYLAAIRTAVDAAGADLVINARVDVFLQQYGEPEQRATEAIARGQRYLQAGADCVFPIFAEDIQDIRSLITAFDGRVNLLCRPDGLRLSQLIELGPARISFGPTLYWATKSTYGKQLEKIATGSDPF